LFIICSSKFKYCKVENIPAQHKVKLTLPKQCWQHEDCLPLHKSAKYYNKDSANIVVFGKSDMIQCIRSSLEMHLTVAESVNMETISCHC
jgi:hypothetical protein